VTQKPNGVGLQANPHILTIWEQIEAHPGLEFDFVELLCDSFAGPLDSGQPIDPLARPLLERQMSKKPCIAHGNYGAEFGFEPLEETPSVLRHVAVAHAMESPWYADHMFYGARASSFLWSSPLQFSRAEAERVAGRAAALQDALKMPLLHENAFYYAPFPGSVIAEAEFIAELVERAQTHLLVDLHNVFANSVDHPGYDRWAFLRTIPLDRVMEVHLAGGQWLEDYYHDLHNHSVPEEVWEMLAWLVPRAKNLQAITLEVQGPAHTVESRPIDAHWPTMIKNDLARARSIWQAGRAGSP
jgi:uncharacterized protein (UPF0276 family)